MWTDKYIQQLEILVIFQRCLYSHRRLYLPWNSVWFNGIPFGGGDPAYLEPNKFSCVLASQSLTYLLHPSWSLTIAMSSAAPALLKAFHVKPAGLLRPCWAMCVFMYVCGGLRVCLFVCPGAWSLSTASYQMDMSDISAAKDFPHKQPLKHWQVGLTAAHRWNSHMSYITLSHKV